MRIGVIGATGKAGRGVIDILGKETEHFIVLGGRKEEVLDQLARTLNGQVKVMYVDVYEEKTLLSFCEECDALINCAGPSSKILGRIAKACIEKNCLYVDTSGDKAMYQKIKQEINKKEDALCVLSAGIYPGLTEIFADYIAKQYDSIHTLKEYFRGNSELSFNAAYDLVSSMENKEGAGMSYCKQGVVTKLTLDSSSSKHLPNSTEAVMILPLISEEFLQIVKTNQIEEGYFYNTFPNHDTMMQFMMIKALEQFKTEEQKSQSANKLCRLFLQQKKHSDPSVLLLIESEGKKQEKAKKREDVLISDENWNDITGYIAALTTLYLLKQKTPNHGIYFASNVVDSKEMIQKLLDYKKVQLYKEER
jgi:saccharopine dehydrogenase (NAD+, L-lysine-forming)